MWHPQSIYAEFLQSQPPIYMGKDGLYGLADFPAAKIVVISGRGLNEDKKEILRSVFKKSELHFINKSWKGEPVIEELKDTIQEIETIRPDTFVAVGGGSVIDGTKICRALYEFPYLTDQSIRKPELSFTTKFIVIPTTIGSGAEASSAAVYYDPAIRSKRMFVDDGLRPDVIILYPDLVDGSSRQFLAAFCADILTHSLEGYVSKLSNPLSDIIAETAIHTVYQEYLKESADEIDYQRLQYAGYYGGIVQNECLVGIDHAVAHQLSAIDIPHSSAVAFLLPYTIQVHLRNHSIAEKLSALSRNTINESVDSLLAFTNRLKDDAVSQKVAQNIKNYLDSSLNDAQFITNVIRDPSGKGNPETIDEDFLHEFIGEILK